MTIRCLGTRGLISSRGMSILAEGVLEGSGSWHRAAGALSMLISKHEEQGDEGIPVHSTFTVSLSKAAIKRGVDGARHEERVLGMSPAWPPMWASGRSNELPTKVLESALDMVTF